MKEIRFNHNYKKLHNQTSAELIYYDFKSGAEFHKEFIKYDTDNKYEIDKTQEYLFLVFIGNKDIVFTTLRKANLENLLKYALGRKYKIVVEKEQK